MSKLTVEANPDIVAAIEHYYSGQFLKELTTTRNGRFKTKYGNRVPLCECCGYSIMDKRYNFCPRCGERVVTE